MTVAEDALKTHSATRMWYLLIGGILCVLMIVFGYFLTQRQMEIIAPKTMTEVELNVKKDLYKFKSTYPGLVLIICGTILGG